MISCSTPQTNFDSNGLYIFSSISLVSISNNPPSKQLQVLLGDYWVPKDISIDPKFFFYRLKYV